MTSERESRMNVIVRAARQRDGPERAIYLAEVCQSDVDLLRSIERILNAESTTDTLRDPLPQDGLSGRTISHYQILEELGRGGMGVVYKARDLKLGRLVALKFLAPNVASSDEYKTRLVREARAAAAIEDPNICTVHEFGEADGLSYLAMAFVDGPTLKDRLRRGRLAIEEAVRIGVETARGLDAAHRKGVVHRDIKTSNIMLAANGRPVITDFGLAHLETEPGISRAGSLAGTPAYMPPERIRGEKADHRSDIWSLGVVIYEMVAGQLPFPIGGSLAAILNENPEPLRTVRPEVPGELDRIVGKALAKAPPDRYQTAKELASDLQTVFANAPVIHPTPPVRFKPARILLYLALLIFLAVGGAALWKWRSPSSATTATRRSSIAVLPLDNLSGDPEQQYFSDGMTDAIITDLAQIGGLRVISRTSAAFFKSRREPIREMTRELRLDHVVEGSVLRSGNRVRITVQLIDAANDRHLWARNYDRDLTDVLQLQSEVARAIASEIRVRLTPVEQARLEMRGQVNPRAYEAYLKGFFYTMRWQRQGIEKGREYFRQAIAEDPNYGPAYAGLADTYVSQGFTRGVPPKDLLPKAREALDRAIQLGGSQSLPFRLQGIIEGVYMRNWPEAEHHLEMAIRLAPQNHWPHYTYAAYYLVPMGRLDDALEEIRRARDAAPLSLNVGVTSGWIRVYRREYALAAAEFRKMLELDPNFSPARYGLGTVLSYQGQHSAALATYDGPAFSGWVYARQGNRAKAHEILAGLKERSKREFVGGVDLASIHVALGENSQALDELERSFQDHVPQLANIRVDPSLDALRSEPRFSQLVRKMNLPE